jgi:hypothetical protein
MLSRDLILNIRDNSIRKKRGVSFFQKQNGKGNEL